MASSGFPFPERCRSIGYGLIVAWSYSVPMQDWDVNRRTVWIRVSRADPQLIDRDELPTGNFDQEGGDRQSHPQHYR